MDIQYSVPWSWNSNTLATWYKELTYWKTPWCWERLMAGEEGHGRGWDGWMASLTQWTWVWANSGSWWWTGKLVCCSPWSLKESDINEWLNWTCHTLTWISHGYICVPLILPTPLPPHPISPGCPRAPALGTLLHASNLPWSSILCMAMYMFQCYPLKSFHPCLLPLSPKVCSLHLCLLCCPACRIISTIFLNSIYMH